ncbi:FAD/FMN-containing dehydrogenase [Bacillus thermophilus]|uniref:FAD/FMN-containing dehydrogenase n=1 Tax=Siminovitchia thermophila TaxID=1245522 RepID=A0ABS2R669_9BACI|nr:FAD/FMN-containing dehydrogenase [Siminovitchia thermophila]
MDIYKEMCDLIGKSKVSINETLLQHHSKDESDYEAVKPDVVVFPETKDDVVQIVEYANKHHIPVVPFGAGSGLEGQAIPIHKGISMNFERMNTIVEVRPEDLVAIVQPGVTRVQLNEELKNTDCFFLLIRVRMRPLAEWPQQMPAAL